MPNNLTTSLELSKKLKENGFPQSTMFSYYYEKPYILLCEMRKGMWLDEDGWPNTTLEAKDIISSPLAEEIARELPDDFIYSKKDGKYICEKLGNRCWYEDGGNYPQNAPYSKADTLCNCMAKMWLYLKENDLINPKKM